MKKKLLLLSLGTACLSLAPSLAAENLGIHCWQQKPYNHVFCFEVGNTNGKYFSLLGENTIPNEGTYPTQGSALLDEKLGKFRLEFKQNLGGLDVYENSAAISPENLSGTWSDDAGNAGDFQYLGTGPLDPATLGELTGSRKKPKTSPRN